MAPSGEECWDGSLWNPLRGAGTEGRGAEGTLQEPGEFAGYSIRSWAKAVPWDAFLLHGLRDSGENKRVESP